MSSVVHWLPVCGLTRTAIREPPYAPIPQRLLRAQAAQKIRDASQPWTRNRTRYCHPIACGPVGYQSTCMYLREPSRIMHQDNNSCSRATTNGLCRLSNSPTSPCRTRPRHPSELLPPESPTAFAFNTESWLQITCLCATTIRFPVVSYKKNYYCLGQKPNWKAGKVQPLTT